MECKQKENLKNCPCTYPECPRKGICCKCIKHHRDNRELPACLVLYKRQRSVEKKQDFFE